MKLKMFTDKGAQALKMFMKLLCTLSFFPLHREFHNERAI